jgi:hypothetical protein
MYHTGDGVTTIFPVHIRERPPWMRPGDHAQMLKGLRKAGLPEISNRDRDGRRIANAQLKILSPLDLLVR